MHRRAKTHRDNFRGLTIYIAGERDICQFLKKVLPIDNG
jgi:hypothetical protein